jgi:ribonuclease HI
MNILIYCDGGCRGNGRTYPPPECYGSYAVEAKGVLQKIERMQFPNHSTSQAAELAILLVTLRYINRSMPLWLHWGKINNQEIHVEVKTDSAFAIGAATNFKIKAEHLIQLADDLKIEYSKAKSRINLIHMSGFEIKKILGH